ncbi:NSP2 [Rotavirus I]|uniref:NSP2 n=1 Tax=Rotavirus I TaxID=1637496 RepID=A0A0E3JSK5_9REOV|nr:NSP2 [Rotavirus I]AKA63269.1 NSP2 [Rotavirus I]
MALKLSLSDFVTRNDDGNFIPSDLSGEPLSRYMTKDEKSVRDDLKAEKGPRGKIRVKLFLMQSCKLRRTQKGIVPLNELKSGNNPTSTLKALFTPWLLNLLNDEETQEQVIAYMEDKFEDIFVSSDKLARVCLRLEDKDDVIHTDPELAVKTFFCMCNAMNSTIATEGKCEIIRATEDGIIVKFDPLPENFTVGKSKGTFYKMFPVNKDTIPVQAFKALSYVSGRDIIMYHGRGHVRTVPFNEILGCVYGLSNKSKDDLIKIKSDPLCSASGEKMVAIADMLISGEKPQEILRRVTVRTQK